MRSEGNYLLGNNVVMFFFSQLVIAGQWHLVFRTYKFGRGRFFFIARFACEHHYLDLCFAKIMSINDKIKVLWKKSLMDSTKSEIFID